MLRNNTPQLAHEGKVLGVQCEFNVWSIFKLGNNIKPRYISTCSKMVASFTNID